MTSEAIAVYASRRREASDRIINSADQFMVRSQCLSIAYRRASVCPVCKSYRFCTSPEVVRVVAEVMKGFAFPVTAGVVPRYEGVASASEEPEHEEGGYGRRAVKELLPGLRRRHQLDVVIANGENSAWQFATRHKVEAVAAIIENEGKRCLR